MATCEQELEDLLILPFGLLCQPEVTGKESTV